jgi:DNA-binding transcriptional LysR family regulator
MRKSDQIERRLKLHDLRVLMAVTQAGSMLKAAKQLNTSQPAISRSIAELEQTLGVRLLERSRQGVVPTDYGRALLDCGTAVFDDLRQGIKNIEFLSDPAEGELTVAGNLPGFAGLIPAAIERFRRKYPRIQLRTIFMAEVPQQHRALRERTVDFFCGRLVPPFEKDLEAEIFFNEGLVVVAGAHNPWTRRRNVRLADLIDEPWLLPGIDAPVGSLIAEVFRASGLELPQNSVATDAVQYMQSVVTRGNFLAFYPTSPLRLGKALPGLKALPVALPIPPSPFGILRLKRRALSPIAQLFIAAAREVAKPLVEQRIVRRT